jgi:hypothetical protein
VNGSTPQARSSSATGAVRGRAVEPLECRQHLGAAALRRRGEEVREPLRPDQHRERVVALRPGRADQALAVREAVRAGGAPDRLRVGGDDLRRQRLVLAVQAREAGVGNAAVERRR